MSDDFPRLVPLWYGMYEPGVSSLIIGVAIQNGDVGWCQLMPVSIWAVMNNHKAFYIYQRGEWPGRCSLVVRHANVAATEWGSSGCGYQPGDSFPSYDLNLGGQDCLVFYWYTLWHPRPRQWNNSTMYILCPVVPEIVFKDWLSRLSGRLDCAKCCLRQQCMNNVVNWC